MSVCRYRQTDMCQINRHPQSFHISRLPCHVRTCQKTYVPTGHILSLFPKPNDIIQQFPQHFHISDCDMHYFLVGMSGQQFTRSKPVFPVPDTSDLLPVYRKLHSSRLYVAERHSLSNVLKSEHPSESTNESVHRGYFLPIHLHKPNKNAVQRLMLHSVFCLEFISPADPQSGYSLQSGWV